MHQLSFVIRTHGGRRAGAGRKSTAPRPNVPHRSRGLHDPRCPVHITLRAVPLPASLRAERPFAAVRDALSRSSTRAFRVLHFSVQRNHVHLIVEADTAPARTRGVQGLAIRVAKAVNRALGRRGTVWSDRHHSHLLATPRAVRHALVYVLQNFRKHGHRETGIDPCSSARWFSGWKIAIRKPEGTPPVARARSWLARWGWRRLGLVEVREAPAGTR
jgi:REP element-mobilizing transposase RayT